MYEKASEPVISTNHFIWRVFKHALYVVGFLVLSVLLGALGFMLIEGLPFKDASLVAAHILAGLGLIQLPETYAGRVFVALFGLYASLFFLAAFSVIFAPVVHRIVHKLHLDTDN